MKYYQKTGVLTSNVDSILGKGYAGHGEGKNNPEMEMVKSTGPLPKGKYTIGEPYNSPNTGPFTIPLTPFPENNMFGRGDFKIHGDNIRYPGTASHGCIILSRVERSLIDASTDKILEVL